MRALILSRLVVDYSRILLRTIAPMRRNAEGLADSVLISAVYIGQQEGRPMTAHKLAQFCSIPRPTVVRKLRELVAIGLLEMSDGAARIPAATLASRELEKNTAELAKLVHRAARELSKLDTKAIARRTKK